MSAVVETASTETNDISLVERIHKIEEALKDLKRAARHELKNRRRRRARKNADGSAAPKGDTPQQLKAWHEEVRKVWDEMRKADAKTPYKRAVAEASARRKGPATPAPVVAKAKKAAAPASTSVAPPAPVEEVKPKRVAKKSA